MTDNELRELIKEKMKFIQDSCKAGLTKDNLIKVNQAVEALNKIISDLETHGSNPDIGDALKELLKENRIAEDNPLQFPPTEDTLESYNERTKSPFSDDYNPFPEDSILPLPEAFPLERKITVEDLRYAAYNALVSSKIEGKDAIQYSIENNMPVGQQFFDWRNKCGELADPSLNLKLDKRSVFEYAYKQNLTIMGESPFLYAIKNDVGMSQDIFNDLLNSKDASISDQRISVYAGNNNLKVLGKDWIDYIISKKIVHDFTEKEINSLPESSRRKVINYCLDNNLRIRISGEEKSPVKYAIDNKVVVSQESFNDYFESLNKDTTDYMNSVRYASENNLKINGYHAVEYACRKAIKINERVPYEYMEDKGLKVTEEIFNEFIGNSRLKVIGSNDSISKAVNYAIMRNFDIRESKDLFRASASFETIKDGDELFATVIHKARFIKLDQTVFSDYLKKNELIKDGKVTDEAIVDYAISKGLQIEGKNAIEYLSDPGEILFRELYEETLDFFKKRMNDPNFKKSLNQNDIYDSWKLFMKEKKVLGLNASAVMKILEKEDGFLEGMEKKLKLISDPLREKGVSAILRAKNMDSLANAVDSFAQSFFKLFGRAREQIVRDKTLEQAYSNKSKLRK
jgi:hypothetical protein